MALVLAPVLVLMATHVRVLEAEATASSAGRNTPREIDGGVIHGGRVVDAPDFGGRVGQDTVQTLIDETSTISTGLLSDKRVELHSIVLRRASRLRLSFSEISGGGAPLLYILFRGTDTGRIRHVVLNGPSENDGVEHLPSLTGLIESARLSTDWVDVPAGEYTLAVSTTQPGVTLSYRVRADRR